jgi:hypothetical protein
MESRLHDLHHETREGPVQSSSYRPISLLYMVSKLLDKLLPARILVEISGQRLLREERFMFRPKHTTALQLARLLIVQELWRKQANRRSVPGCD